MNAGSMPANVTVHVARGVRRLDRFVAIATVLDEEPGAGILYAATPDDVDVLFGFVACYRARRISVARWHERMSPEERAESVSRLVDGVVRVLVATRAFTPDERTLGSVRFVISCDGAA